MNLRDLVNFVRRHSVYYRELYAHLPTELPSSQVDLLRLLPVIDSTSYWAANGLEDNRVLTSELSDGIVFKSGGTTGAPKFSVFSRKEWSHFCESFARGLVAGGLKEGERIANLFYAGELYASFLFILKSFESAPLKSLHLPLTGSASTESVLKTLSDLKATTLVGTPTMILQLAEAAHAQNLQFPALRRILYGGESLYDDQRQRLLELFPNVVVRSIGYASVDAGLLGYADESCRGDEHRAFGLETIYEILDEHTLEPIDEVGITGKAFVTYLDRRLMPIIRYPVGDRAQWVDDAGVLDRRFRLLGRSEEAARVGPCSVYYDDIHDAFAAAQADDERYLMAGFQLVIHHFEKRDQLTLRLSPSHPGLFEEDWVRTLLAARPMLRDEWEKGNIHPPRVELVSYQHLEKNPRTGKIKRVIDLRKSP